MASVSQTMIDGTEIPLHSVAPQEKKMMKTKNGEGDNQTVRGIKQLLVGPLEGFLYSRLKGPWMVE